MKQEYGDSERVIKLLRQMDLEEAVRFLKRMGPEKTMELLGEMDSEYMGKLAEADGGVMKRLVKEIGPEAAEKYSKQLREATRITNTLNDELDTATRELEQHQKNMQMQELYEVLPKLVFWVVILAGVVLFLFFSLHSGTP